MSPKIFLYFLLLSFWGSEVSAGTIRRAEARFRRTDKENCFIVKAKRNATSLYNKYDGEGGGIQSKTGMFHKCNYRAEDLDKLADDEDVEYVEEDTVVRGEGQQSTGTTYWNLDRVDQSSLPYDGLFQWQYTGQGVPIYIFDTGVNGAHEEFTGRMGQGKDFYTPGGDPNVDCNGHGTHVAGIAAGSTSGVAKLATVVSVRVMGCDNGGTTSLVIAGINWVLTQPRGVMVMSLGGAYSQSLNDAVAAAVAQNYVVVVAAGNSNADACNQSPASAPAAITVGATDNQDRRSSYSNYGSCVNLFAPGDNIISASNTVNNGYVAKWGTSMAAPLVAGGAASYLSGNPSLSSQQIAAIVGNQATSGLLANILGSPNLLLKTFGIPDLRSRSPSPSPVSGSPSRSPPPPSPSPIIPPNDVCVDAINLPCNTTVQGSTRFAAFNGSPATCGTTHTAPEVWYAINVPAGQVTVSMCNAATYDTKLTIWGGSCAAGDLSGLQCIGGADDSSGCRVTSMMSQNMAAGRYLVMVHGYSAQTGDFSLTLTCPPAPTPSPAVAVPSPSPAVPSPSPAVPSPSPAVPSPSPAVPSPEASPSASRSSSPMPSTSPAASTSASRSASPLPSASSLPSPSVSPATASPSASLSPSPMPSRTPSPSRSASRSASSSRSPSPSPVSASPSLSPVSASPSLSPVSASPSRSPSRSPSPSRSASRSRSPFSPTASPSTSPRASFSPNLPASPRAMPSPSPSPAPSARPSPSPTTGLVAPASILTPVVGTVVGIVKPVLDLLTGLVSAVLPSSSSTTTSCATKLCQNALSAKATPIHPSSGSMYTTGLEDWGYQIGTQEQITSQSAADLSALAATMDKTKVINYAEGFHAHVVAQQSDDYVLSTPMDPAITVTVSEWGTGVAKAVVTSFLINSQTLDQLHLKQDDTNPILFASQVDRMDEDGHLLNGKPLTLQVKVSQGTPFTVTLHSAGQSEGVDLTSAGGYFTYDSACKCYTVHVPRSSLIVIRTPSQSSQGVTSDLPNDSVPYVALGCIAFISMIGGALGYALCRLNRRAKPVAELMEVTSSFSLGSECEFTPCPPCPMTLTAIPLQHIECQ